ncbi:hypothetical protein QBC46DRAFT_372279 [Diplogelasinospora grovesii]|uniref:DUF3752 domain-containing protein n=1 Tax=Diplogelasinospora grovesii TaxID=303347 RepID=A0AAN6S9I8_9PEZI|nr:hypothetical protein QBC46DRAFT_372279 [Diplogelasinospora grovesii]
MAPIGPQLPPHLQKRKRTPEDDAPSPPAKAPRRDNQDEIPLDGDSSDDDGYGPSAPAAGTSGRPNGTVSAQPRPAIGPSLPPHLRNEDEAVKDTTKKEKRPIGPARPPLSTNEEEIQLDDYDDDDDDDVGPAPPRSIGPAAPPAPTQQKRTYGPAPPPAPLSERPSHPPNPELDSDSDSDDGYGPALPSSTSVSQSRSYGPAFPPPPPEPVALKRDDWMTAPPTDDSRRAPDPTKLRNRKFASGPRAATSADPKGGGISSIWTETPEEKRKRLADAVLGRADPTTQAGQAAPSVSKAQKAVDERRVKAFTEQTRGRSLVEEHMALKQAGKSAKKGDKKDKKEEEEEDDPSKRAFDKEKDMAIGGRLSGTQKRELLSKAANFGGRFSSGSYL